MKSRRDEFNRQDAESAKATTPTDKTMKDKVEASAKIVLGNINEEIKVRQSELQQLMITRDSLIELYELTPIPGIVPDKLPALVKPWPAAPKTKPAKKPDVAAAYRAEMHPGEAAPTHKGRAPSADTVKLMAVMRTAPEPFTMDSLRVASGITNTKTITNALTRGKAQGWLKSEVRGEYMRTATFPATTPDE